MERSKVAIFVDVENLTQWIKDGGTERLLSELSSIGQIIVRRAYGKWTNQNLQSFQGELNRQGFELIHNFHPVSGKNSSDIQLTVDVMEYALRLNDVDWFVLATGDSDFSPLFRRLREMGKEVIGVGPRSPLSESVKTSCSRFIYTDKGVTANREALNSALDDAIDLAEKALQTFDGAALCSKLKQSMTNIDSAFDEKALGFKSFNEFLKSIDSIEVAFDSTSRAWQASFISSNEAIPSKEMLESSDSISTEELYRRFLRKKHWRAIPTHLLIEIYQRVIDLEPLTKDNLAETLLERMQSEVTSADVKKALAIFRKAKLFTQLPSDNQDDIEDKLWKVERNDNFLLAIDQALLARLMSVLKENHCDPDHDAIKRILHGQYNSKKFGKLLSDAREEREFRGHLI